MLVEIHYMGNIKMRLIKAYNSIGKICFSIPKSDFICLKIKHLFDDICFHIQIKRGRTSCGMDISKETHSVFFKEENI
jgi:hypothetical protein